MKHFSEYLRDHHVASLFYLTPLANLESILAHGILCLHAAGGLRREDISNDAVQRRREKWHGHVPLFFADNTPMLYEVCRSNLFAVLLEISTAVANCGDVWFSDGNVASGESKEYNDPVALEKLDWSIIRSGEPAFGTDRHGRNWKRIRAAEVLIPGKCSAEHIQGVYYQPEPECIREKLQKILDNSPHSREISLKPDLTPRGI
ncbi:MAG: DUF4433 domain-containing protein [Gammaproteobacteria bacterium]|nr:DUF4433 domain-containing protein [Gammaproteobacteria bacterium]